MDLSTPELKVFKTVLNKPGIRIEEFMNKTKSSKPNAYHILRNLKSKNLVKPANKPVEYTIPKNEKAVQLSHLFKIYGPYRVEIALSKKNHPLLKEILHEGKTAEDLAGTTGLSKSQIYKIMSKFANMGLVQNFNNQFHISQDHPLYKCLLEYENPPRLNAELEKNGEILWQGDGEYLIQTDD
ncbi:MAG: TrmB family transcriptional regulator, partial [Candidatus Altiarchaeales archaeon]|nr:TrmB family transcriptional regulator [Candidatus Altiarchaeales archaeon]